jgi:hypothetical protein
MGEPFMFVVLFCQIFKKKRCSSFFELISPFRICVLLALISVSDFGEDSSVLVGSQKTITYYIQNKGNEAQ